jgi:hypothetical protein
VLDPHERMEQRAPEACAVARSVDVRRRGPAQLVDHHAAVALDARRLGQLRQGIAFQQIAGAGVDLNRNRRRLGVAEPVLAEGRVIADQPRRRFVLALAGADHGRADVVIGVGLVAEAPPVTGHGDDARLVAVDQMGEHADLAVAERHL